MNDIADREWSVLKRVAVGEPALGDDVEVSELDPDRLTGMALRHNMASMLAENLLDNGRIEALPHKLGRRLSEALWVNQLKARSFLEESGRLVERLSAAGVQFAFTKGVVCQETLYGGTGAREYNDIDLMIESDRAGAVDEVMVAMGYENKRRLHKVSSQWTERSLKERVAYRVYPDHLPHYYRENGLAVPRYFCVDFAFTLTWYSSPWSIPTATVLSARRPVLVRAPGLERELPALSSVHDFLFLVLHLFRESWFATTALAADVRLGQFADVWRGWRALSSEERSEFAKCLAENDLQVPVAWVAHHVDATLGSDMLDGLDLREFAVEEWTTSGRDTKSFFTWHGDMDRRLRELSLSVESCESVPFVEAE
ncbi:nucleotidyltransferase family protein [Glycomyces buryatensis]|nr:nucleotidyltransferase family protein [Glycomyces buryatensis]